MPIDLDLSALGTEYQSLRHEQGHFSGGDHHRDVDGYGGRKRKVMESLGESLGKPDTHAIQILETMGAPDEIVPKVGASNVGPLQSAGPGAIATGMPGPLVGGGQAPHGQGIDAGKPYFIVYYWRGRHDYLWFEVDGTADERISQYGWHAASD
ncbi:hypothetical protein HKX48_006071 [Thoreauomyces humboldtii]|nr:hypothetical protein HKX48_006071 [Thoreauomyces humboldtii]